MSDPTRPRTLTHPFSRRDLLKAAAAGGATLVLPLSDLAVPEASAQGTGAAAWPRGDAGERQPNGRSTGACESISFAAREVRGIEGGAIADRKANSK